jgi:two-component system, NtrC family, nitrogen regulation sensor histidine kinase NtrY
MVQADLGDFLREIKQEAELRGDFFLELAAGEAPPHLALGFEVPAQSMAQHLDAQMLRRVVINLIQNAAQACRQKGSRVLVSVSTTAQGHELLVEDDGPGVPASMWAQVFEPYVTTKDDGTGLGLAIVKKIVIDHRGDVEMRASRWGGACVRIVLPA